MKKITFFWFVLTLLSNHFLFSQSVNIVGINVDNVSISNNQAINLGSKPTSTVNFTCIVNNSSSPSDSTPGTIAIYYKKQPNASSSPINPSGGGIRGLLFLKGTQAVVSFNISLSASQFDSAGGILYAEYKTYAGTTYKSGNISIIKSSTTPTPPTPTPPTNKPVFASQTIPWGGIPLLFDLKKNQKYVEINYVFVTINAGFIPIIVPVPQVIDFVNGPTYDNKFLNVETKLEDGTTVIESAPTGMKIIVEPFVSNVLYSSYSLNNRISPPNQYVPIGQNPVAIGNPASESYSEGGLIITTPLYRYQWQSRRDENCQCSFIYPEASLEYYGWKNIANATEANYTPPPIQYGVEYRRLVFRNGETKAASSNIVRVYPIDNTVDSSSFASLCCNQTINSNSTISPIVDNVDEFYYTYGWELSSDGDLWYKIDNSKSKDYQPEIKDFIDNDGSFQSRFFRKIKYIRYSEGKQRFYISNVIKITINNANKKSIEKTFQSDYLDTSVIIYPNPSSSFVKIEGKIDLSSSKITMVDLSGKVLIYEKPIISDDSKSLQINISTFPIGIYFLVIDNLGETIVKKIIKK
ncbi:hypothetical protein AR687_05595 [Flavobacteriaceae bacterium CRH]|nr:hypothetical protein AR687_05595 [Flavobacteriaceae bacterium CRH]